MQVGWEERKTGHHQGLCPVAGKRLPRRASSRWTNANDANMVAPSMSFLPDTVPSPDRTDLSTISQGSCEAGIISFQYSHYYYFTDEELSLWWLILRVNWLGYSVKLMGLPYKLLDFEWSILPSIRWVGLIKSVVGLERKDWNLLMRKDCASRLPLDLRLQH